MNLYDQTYHPWSIADGRCIVNTDLLRGCEELRRINSRYVVSDETTTCDVAAKFILIDIPGGDVFGGWEGPVYVGDSFYSIAGPATIEHELRPALFRAIDQCPNLRFLLPTREPENVQKNWRIRLYEEAGAEFADDVVDNLALAFRFSDQDALDRGMLAFVRCAPLCEKLFWWFDAGKDKVVLRDHWQAPDGLIISGHPTEPTNLDAVRSAIAQCRAAGVKVYYFGSHEAKGTPKDCQVQEDVWA